MMKLRSYRARSANRMVFPGKKFGKVLRQCGITARRSLVLPLVLLQAVAFALAPCPVALTEDAPALDARLGGAPLVRRGITLTQALRVLGASTERGYASFGVEEYVSGGKEPTVDLDVRPAAMLEEGLRQILNQLPMYSYRVLSPHFVAIFPKNAVSDANDPLNIMVSRFDVDGITAGIILEWPDGFIPELKARFGPAATGNAKRVDLYVGGVAGGATINMHLRNVTVREILNTVGEAAEKRPFQAYPFGWEYSFDPKTSFGPGGVESWKALMTLPSNWIEQAREAGVSAP